MTGCILFIFQSTTLLSANRVTNMVLWDKADNNTHNSTNLHFMKLLKIGFFLRASVGRWVSQYQICFCKFFSKSKKISSTTITITRLLLFLQIGFFSGLRGSVVCVTFFCISPPSSVFIFIFRKTPIHLAPFLILPFPIFTFKFHLNLLLPCQLFTKSGPP